jgi:hypothetical protein
VSVRRPCPSAAIVADASSGSNGTSQTSVDEAMDVIGITV